MIRALILACLIVTAAHAEVVDPRYCGPPKRDSKNVIIRDWKVLRDFRSLYACPSTGRKTGACPNWSVDHVIPLVCGGCDATFNAQFLPNAIKSGPGALPKDRWERRVYCGAGELAPPPHEQLPAQ